MTAITGNTYPVRVELRGLGGQWDKANKAWMVPDEKAEEARALVGSTRGPKVSRRYTGGSLTRYGGGRGYLGTDENGCAHFGRACGCEDYPCCGH
jgi:hypothetical protein